MADFEQTFPLLLNELLQLEFDYADGEGIDFEPNEEFQPAAENQDWIRSWTGNEELTGAEYRIFGQDGTGGLAGFWLIRPDAELLEQPIVFFGSEGEVGIVAYDFADFLWLLAAGIGPMEAVDEYFDGEEKPNADFTEFASKYAADAKKSATAVQARAKEAYPTFADDFMALCRH